MSRRRCDAADSKTPGNSAGMPGVVFILNGAAGANRADEARESIARVAAESGAIARIQIAGSGADICDFARLAVKEGAVAVIAGGGDGTVNAVASTLLGSEVALGVLPLGTLNHFAKDLGIPLDIEAATRNIFQGRQVSVDVGEVNGRIFLNNSSLGVYPRVVRYREAHRAQGHNKWVAFVRAILLVLRRHALFHVRLRIDRDKELSRATAFVFVGNNEYEMTGLRIGARKALDAGNLWVCLPSRGGRADLVRLALRALLGRLQGSDLHLLSAREMVIHTGKKRSSVAIDGEVANMAPPLKYRILPRALKVIVPAADGIEPDA
jgi:diacylglycerol kinase family enzyme